MVLAAGGAGFIAVKGSLDDAAHRRVYVDRTQAVSPLIEQGTPGEAAVRAVHAPDRERVDVESRRTDEAVPRERQCPVL